MKGTNDGRSGGANEGAKGAMTSKNACDIANEKGLKTKKKTKKENPLCIFLKHLQ